ncbi:SDR family NAD(P)-dependent oxidoreductase [Sphingobium chungbukense]|uniref:3-hydroxyacyl-CoA dehydrogenase n=1 Tax=Sphingobium chungbukense TaxID=56193 RepID=A0A0M3ASZ9_9SPHN|nr:SDR family NAD(P)-dependent oxidoreductase [Sphingobium chungbukense]KKW92066.1 3-hydroxyacyl-CoA dehydrogenase [Sphingobium chungbukense]
MDGFLRLRRIAGRTHALALAKHGARVVVNDMNADQADAVAEEIKASGGEAIAFAASVTDLAAVTAMVEAVIARWSKVDILVNNAGILRDKSFAKMNLDDFRLVLDVHLMGSVNCTKAVWNHMRDHGYGRIVFTTSSSGLYGNFGQANYGAAKMALVGLMQTLSIEGERSNIKVNCLAPSAATQMTNGLYSQEVLSTLGAEIVSPAVVALVAENAPNRRILLAGGGSFEQANITMTQGLFLAESDDVANDILVRLDEIADRTDEMIPLSGVEQHQFESARQVAKSTAFAD